MNHWETIKIKIWAKAVPKLKSRQTYLKLCTMADLKMLILFLKTLCLNTNFNQIGAKIKISLDLLENVCNSHFEDISIMEWF